MKLICIGGAYERTNYDIQPPGISLGREEDNDIVLNDSETSRYHAKVEQFDGVWYVHDLNSSNGVLLNGKRITASAPLSLQDEIRIGRTTFRFVDDQPPPAAEPAAAAAAPAPATTPKRNLLTLGLTALLTVLVVVVIVVVMLPSPPAKPVPGADSGAQLAAKAPLQVYYENVEVAKGKVFRFQLTIADGNLQVVADDPVNQMRIEDGMTLQDAQQEILRTSLMTDAFMELTSPPAERRETGLSAARLLVRAGPKGNFVEYENTARAPAFANAVSQLEQFVQSELGIYAASMPREDVIKQADQMYKAALRLDQERDVDPPNLFQALKGYRHVLERLKWMDSKPDFYAEAQARLEKGRNDLTQQLEDLKRNSITLHNVGELVKARDCLTHIIERIPERNTEFDKYLQFARSTSIKLDDQIKKHH